MVNIGLMIAGILGAVVGIFLLAPSTYVGYSSWSDVSSWGSRGIHDGFVEAIDPPNDHRNVLTESKYELFFKRFALYPCF